LGEEKVDDLDLMGVMEELGVREMEGVRMEEGAMVTGVEGLMEVTL
jgi:hypothetical protein